MSRLFNYYYREIPGIMAVLIAVALIAAWITHIGFCIINELWILLFVGALVAPAGVIHGVMIWLGLV